jgi:hypothetical protein
MRSLLVRSDPLIYLKQDWDHNVVTYFEQLTLRPWRGRELFPERPPNGQCEMSEHSVVHLQCMRSPEAVESHGSHYEIS